jgi:hypothetical protein
MCILIMIIKNHGHNVMFHITYDQCHMSLHLFVPQRQGIHVDFMPSLLQNVGAIH